MARWPLSAPSLSFPSVQRSLGRGKDINEQTLRVGFVFIENFAAPSFFTF